MKLKNLKSMFTATLAATLVVSALSGCGKTATDENGATVNTTYEDGADLLTITDKTVKGDDSRLLPFPVLGFAYQIPESWGSFDELHFVQIDDSICISFLPPSLLPEDLDSLSDEELDKIDFEEIYASQVKLLKTFSVPSDTKEETVIKDNKDYETVEKLATLDGNTYYIAYNNTFSLETYPKLIQKDLNAYLGYTKGITEFRDNIMIFPPQGADEVEGVTTEQIQSLQGLDLQGNSIDAGIFEKYDLTMVNIWATWCGPCVNELPDLANLYQSLPENVNMITICSDADEQADAAREILKECNAKFTTVYGDESIRSTILQNVYSYPTTIFVDKKGEIVGEAVMGALSKDEYFKQIEKLTNVKK